MPIVTDTSVIIAVVLNEPTKQKIIEATKGQELIAPDSLKWEIGNAFSAMFKRNKVSLDQALTGFKIFRQIPIRYPETDFEDALKISFENKIYAYDGYFLSLAKKHKCPFITLDEPLQKLASKLGIKTIEVNNDNI
jgi:predicted nucleic acid-binding protein